MPSMDAYAVNRLPVEMDPLIKHTDGAVCNGAFNFEPMQDHKDPRDVDGNQVAMAPSRRATVSSMPNMASGPSSQSRRASMPIMASTFSEDGQHPVGLFNFKPMQDHKDPGEVDGNQLAWAPVGIGGPLNAGASIQTVESTPVSTMRSQSPALLHNSLGFDSQPDLSRPSHENGNRSVTEDTQDTLASGMPEMVTEEQVTTHSMVGAAGQWCPEPQSLTASSSQPTKPSLANAARRSLVQAPGSPCLEDEVAELCRRIEEDSADLRGGFLLPIVPQDQSTSSPGPISPGLAARESRLPTIHEGSESRSPSPPADAVSSWQTDANNSPPAPAVSSWIVPSGRPFAEFSDTE